MRITRNGGSSEEINRRFKLANVRICKLNRTWKAGHKIAKIIKLRFLKTLVFLIAADDSEI